MPDHRRSATKAVTPRREKIPEHAVPGDLADRRWKLVRQELRYYWNFLSDDDVLRIAGKRDELLRVLNEKYSYTRSRANREIDSALAGRSRKKRNY
jgi:hypothetical protein